MEVFEEATLEGKSGDMYNDGGKLFACRESLEFFQLKEIKNSRFLFTVNSRRFAGAKKFTFRTLYKGDGEFEVEWIYDGGGKCLYPAFEQFLIDSFNQEQTKLSAFKPIYFYRYILIEKIESSN